MYNGIYIKIYYYKNKDETIMKRIIILLISVIMVLSLAACTIHLPIDMPTGIAPSTDTSQPTEESTPTETIKPTEPTEPPITYDVVLTSIGNEDNKVYIIKAIRDNTQLGLKEAKDLADNTPCVIKECTTLIEAEIIKGELEDLGATAEITSESDDFDTLE